MQPRDVVAGRYRIVRRAGAGAMATVFHAQDELQGGDVALKTLRTELQVDTRARARLLREAHALSKIVHPAVVRYVDHGFAGDVPFLVMAWVEGETLRERLDREGVGPDEALRLVERLAGGLSAAHAEGVVHRDLKPSNVMLPDGDLARATIVDFGVARLARALAPSPANVTRTGDHVGTPRYMAPEQIRSARGADRKADVFALGCILFECLTGRPAFGGHDPVTVLARILFEPLPVPSAAMPGVPGVLDALVGEMIDRNVDRRLDARRVEERVGEVRAALDRESWDR
ncbi:MAG: serine/threonine protein kinase, partial [Myxococcales bacterium]|nr:serine/threonine protein kinase [Myxococcales bacterium]